MKNARFIVEQVDRVMIEMRVRGSASATDGAENSYSTVVAPPSPAPTAEKAPTLVLMAGFAGAGKTTLARRLSHWLRWETLNKDDLKLRRLAQGKDVKSEDWNAFVERAGWDAFVELFDLIQERVVQRHQSVIIDTSNEKPFIFENVLHVLEELEKLHIHARLKVILCVATKETRTARLLRRKSVFEPYVHELPTILDDAELPQRFKHLLDDSELPQHIKVDNVLIVNTNPPLGAYDWKVLRALTRSEEQMEALPYRQRV